VKRKIAENFAVFRSNPTKEELGEAELLHYRLEGTLLYMITQMKAICDASEDKYLSIKGSKIKPGYTKPRKIRYMEEFDDSSDPLFFRTQQDRMLERRKAVIPKMSNRAE
jgi:hypothetical protein